MFLSRRYGFDLPALREATPTARFGNLFVFRGSFFVPGLIAEERYWTALSKLYSEKPDISAGEALLRQSAALDPNAFYVNIHLGTVCLRRGSRFGVFEWTWGVGELRKNGINIKLQEQPFQILVTLLRTGRCNTGSAVEPNTSDFGISILGQQPTE